MVTSMDQLLIIVLVCLGIALWFLGRRLWWGRGPLFAFAVFFLVPAGAYAQSSGGSSSSSSSASSGSTSPLTTPGGVSYNYGTPYATVLWSSQDTLGGAFGHFTISTQDSAYAGELAASPYAINFPDCWVGGYYYYPASGQSNWLGLLPAGSPVDGSIIASVVLYDYGSYYFGSVTVCHGYQCVPFMADTSAYPPGTVIKPQYYGQPTTTDTLYVYADKGSTSASAWIANGAKVVRYISSVTATNGYSQATYNCITAPYTGSPLTYTTVPPLPQAPNTSTPPPNPAGYKCPLNDEAIILYNIISPNASTQPTTLPSTQSSTQPAIYKQAGSLLGPKDSSSSDPNQNAGLYDQAHDALTSNTNNFVPSWAPGSATVLGFAYPKNAQDAAAYLNRLPSPTGVNFADAQNKLGLGEVSHYLYLADVD